MLGLPDWMSMNRLVNVIFRHNNSLSKTPNEVKEPQTLHDINCVTSEVIINGEVQFHYPIIDLDCLHWYHESSTEGHGHLVIGVPLTDEQYGDLLRVLKNCGILQEGVYEAQWKASGHTAMRLPGVKKGTDRLPNT